MFNDPVLYFDVCVLLNSNLSWKLVFGVVDDNWKRLIQVLGLEQWGERFRHTHRDVEHAGESGENMISL